MKGGRRELSQKLLDAEAAGAAWASAGNLRALVLDAKSHAAALNEQNARARSKYVRHWLVGYDRETKRQNDMRIIHALNSLTASKSSATR